MSNKVKPNTGNTQLAVGAGLGVYMVSTAATIGSVCPLCVVAMPVFLAWGGIKKYKAHHAKVDFVEE